ncbi:MAG: DUF2281 domain-containing protein [Geitlerinemataceae cyanobacterium]
MTVSEQVYAIVESLSDEQASEVLSFAEQLQQRNAQPETPEEKERRLAQWREKVYALAGAFPDFPSLEEIRAGYGEDVPREEW